MNTPLLPVFWRLSDLNGDEVIINPFHILRMIPIIPSQPLEGTLLQFGRNGPVMQVLVREAIEELLSKGVTDK